MLSSLTLFLMLFFLKRPQCVDLTTPRPPFLLFVVRLLTDGATLWITWYFHRCYDGAMRIIPKASLLAPVEGIFSIRLFEVRRCTLNADSTFSGCPDLKRPRGNASAFAGLSSHLGSEVTYPTCLATELPATGITLETTRGSLGII